MVRLLIYLVVTLLVDYLPLPLLILPIRRLVSGAVSILIAGKHVSVPSIVLVGLLRSIRTTLIGALRTMLMPLNTTPFSMLNCLCTLVTSALLVLELIENSRHMSLSLCLPSNSGRLRMSATFPPTPLDAQTNLWASLPDGRLNMLRTDLLLMIPLRSTIVRLA